jgi:hypothetical protein
VQERIDFTTDQFTYSVEESKDQTVAIFLGVKFGIGF